MSTDFRKLLLDISEALVSTELAALKFLSWDHISRSKLEAIQNSKDFFEVLQEKDLIRVENLSFLKELLYQIGRMDLLTARLGTSREEMERVLQAPGGAQVSAFRRLLYEIAEELTPENVKDVKFLLKNVLKDMLLENASMLQIFQGMEMMTIIQEDNLTVLKDLFGIIRPDLNKIIDAYEQKLKGKFIYLLFKNRAGVFYGFYGSILGCLQNDKVYKMKNNPHGYCLIINNYIFKNPEETREGTMQDGKAVKEVFTWLRFEIVEYKDLAGEIIKKIVEEYSKKDHRNMDGFVCFIFSHGEKGKIKGVDDTCVNIEELVSCFSGSNCPSLAGKPKVFFIQACQGSLYHPSVQVKSDSSSEHLEVDARPLTSIPDMADILIGKSTVENYLSFRFPETGSVYIQSLCKHLRLLCPQGKDLLTILTEVNNEVAREDVQGFKQMPQITSTLLKLLIFEV
ncbi:CASP8 protein, partial [Regulus satrapa]|nr:CASP8 protein [Regulus satrapa]